MIRIENWIDAFRPADGPPPQTLGRFMAWGLSGSWPYLWLAALFSALAGCVEAVTAWILGLVIDTAITSGPDGFFSGQNTKKYREKYAGKKKKGKKPIFRSNLFCFFQSHQPPPAALMLLHHQ